MKFKVSYLTYIYLLLMLLSGLFKELLAFIVIIIFHELGHLIIIRLLGYKAISITLYPFGGSIKINKPINSNIHHDLFISGAGIFNQLILLLIINQFKSSYFIDLIKYHNYLIIFINLIPIYPLDGYKMLNSLLNYVFSYYYSYWISLLIEIISLFLIIKCQSVYQNPLVIMGIISILYLIKNYKLIINNFYLERLYYQFPYYKIKYLTKLNKKYFHIGIKYYYLNNGITWNEKDIITKKG